MILILLFYAIFMEFSEHCYILLLKKTGIFLHFLCSRTIYTTLGLSGFWRFGKNLYQATGPGAFLYWQFFCNSLYFFTEISLLSFLFLLESILIFQRKYPGLHICLHKRVQSSFLFKKKYFFYFNGYFWLVIFYLHICAFCCLFFFRFEIYLVW